MKNYNTRMKWILLVGLVTIITVAEGSYSDENSNIFSAKFLNEVLKSESDKSVIVSGYSVVPMLAQLSLAAAGRTQNELLNVIGITGRNLTESTFESLKNQNGILKSINLKMANCIYIDNSARINQGFAELSRKVFDSDIKNIDFRQSDMAASKINEWVESETYGKIKGLVDPKSIDDSTRVVLVNAIYFKGVWKTPFDELDTIEDDFYVDRDNTIKLMFMNRDGTYAYGESSELDAKLLQIPFATKHTSILLVVPNQIDGLNALTEKLSDSNALQNAVRHMYSAKVSLKLPKFKIETKTNIKDILQKMGVKQMFRADKARLDNLLADEASIYISHAVQKAFIEINEEGAEAAAANAMAIGFLSAFVTYKEVNFIVDKPFYFHVQHYDLILFSGIFHPAPYSENKNNASYKFQRVLKKVFEFFWPK